MNARTDSQKGEEITDRAKLASSETLDKREHLSRSDASSGEFRAMNELIRMHHLLWEGLYDFDLSHDD